MPVCDCYLHRRFRRERVLKIGFFVGLLLAFVYYLLNGR